MIRDLYVLDKDRRIIDTLEFDSIIWTGEYFSTGDYSLKLPLTSENNRIINEGEYICRSDDDNIGVIETVLTERGATKNITVSGRFAKSILDRRIIANPSNLYGGHTNDKYRVSTEELSGLVEVAVKRLVWQNGGPRTALEYRKLSCLKVESTKGIAIRFENRRQTTASNLLNFTDETLKEFGLGARVVIDRSDRMFEYQIIQGKDLSKGNTEGNRPVIFSEKQDNFFASEKTKSNAEYKNVALVGGSGEGGDRFYSVVNWEVIAADDDEHRDMKRREMFIDARDVSKTHVSGDETVEYSDADYKDMLIERGKNELSDRKTEDRFHGDIDLTKSLYKYKEDFNLGDIVTVIDEEGTVHTKRIITVTEVQDKDGYEVKPSVDNP